MVCYSGLVWKDGCFSEGYVVIEDGRVVETGDGIPHGSEDAGYILPGLTDAHTHVGDAGLRLNQNRRYSLEELVAPPDGLKHRYLRETPIRQIEEDMADYARRLGNSGVRRFIDFREGVSRVRRRSVAHRRVRSSSAVRFRRSSIPTRWTCSWTPQTASGSPA